MVNTAQQVGGSVGTTLLSTIFAGAVTGYLATHVRTPSLPSSAAIHGYTAGFTAGGVIFAVGLVLALILLPSRRLSKPGPPPRAPHLPPLTAWTSLLNTNRPAPADRGMPVRAY